MGTYKNPKIGETYISPPFDDSFGDKKVRVITRAIGDSESFEFAKIGKELVLRETPHKKKVIKATVIEESNRIKVLNFQDFTPSTGNPHKNNYAFVEDEIPKLLKFLTDISNMEFKGKKYLRLTENDIKNIDINQNQALQLFLENKELFTEAISGNVTARDIITLSHNKKQLEVFNNLIYDEDYFNEMKTTKKCTNEGLWQAFFEKNTWIFGYGLGYIFLNELDGKKLEQIVQGHNLNTFGKRVDAVMKTAGIISNLCFVEIKTHKTKLLEDTPYRSGCFAPSKELSGAVSQVQGSVYSAVKSLTEHIVVSDKNGNPTGENLYNYDPKSFLVIGSLEEFTTKNGINKEKLRSFELYRKSIHYPEIITFDELLYRTEFIVNTQKDISDIATKEKTVYL